MREIRPSGSEGGAEQTNAPSLPPIKPGGLLVVPHLLRRLWYRLNRVARLSRRGSFSENESHVFLLVNMNTQNLLLPDPSLRILPGFLHVPARMASCGMIIALIALAPTTSMASMLTEVAEFFVKKVVPTAGDDVAEAAARRTVIRAAAGDVGERAVLSAADEAAGLAQAASKYGDDVMRYAGQSPDVARALATSADTLMPLARRHGQHALLIEAKVPGAFQKLSAAMPRHLLEKVAAKAGGRELQTLCILAGNARPGIFQQWTRIVARGGGWVLRYVPIERAMTLAAVGVCIYVVMNSPEQTARVLIGALAGEFGITVALLVWSVLVALLYALRKPIRFLLAPLLALIRRRPAPGNA